MVNIQDTSEKFQKYPSESKAQQIESLVEGISIDHKDDDNVWDERYKVDYSSITSESNEPNEPY